MAQASPSVIQVDVVNTSDPALTAEETYNLLNVPKEINVNVKSSVISKLRSGDKAHLAQKLLSQGLGSLSSHEALEFSVTRKGFITMDVQVRSKGSSSVADLVVKNSVYAAEVVIDLQNEIDSRLSNYSRIIQESRERRVTAIEVNTQLLMVLNTLNAGYLPETYNGLINEYNTLKLALSMNNIVVSLRNLSAFLVKLRREVDHKLTTVKAVNEILGRLPENLQEENEEGVALVDIPHLKTWFGCVNALLQGTLNIDRVFQVLYNFVGYYVTNELCSQAQTGYIWGSYSFTKLHRELIKFNTKDKAFFEQSLETMTSLCTTSASESSTCEERMGQSSQIFNHIAKLHQLLNTGQSGAAQFNDVPSSAAELLAQLEVSKIEYLSAMVPGYTKNYVHNIKDTLKSFGGYLPSWRTSGVLALAAGLAYAGFRGYQSYFGTPLQSPAEPLMLGEPFDYVEGTQVNEAGEHPISVLQRPFPPRVNMNKRTVTQVVDIDPRVLVQESYAQNYTSKHAEFREDGGYRPRSSLSDPPASAWITRVNARPSSATLGANLPLPPKASSATPVAKASSATPVDLGPSGENPRPLEPVPGRTGVYKFANPPKGSSTATSGGAPLAGSGIVLNQPVQNVDSSGSTLLKGGARYRKRSQLLY